MQVTTKDEKNEWKEKDYANTFPNNDFNGNSIECIPLYIIRMRSLSFPPFIHLCIIYRVDIFHWVLFRPDRRLFACGKWWRRYCFRTTSDTPNIIHSWHSLNDHKITPDSLYWFELQPKWKWPNIEWSKFRQKTNTQRQMPQNIDTEMYRTKGLLLAWAFNKNVLSFC